MSHCKDAGEPTSIVACQKGFHIEVELWDPTSTC